MCFKLQYLSQNHTEEKYFVRCGPTSSLILSRTLCQDLDVPDLI